MCFLSFFHLAAFFERGMPGSGAHDEFLGGVISLSDVDLSGVCSRDVFVN